MARPGLAGQDELLVPASAQSGFLQVQGVVQASAGGIADVACGAGRGGPVLLGRGGDLAKPGLRDTQAQHDQE